MTGESSIITQSRAVVAHVVATWCVAVGASSPSVGGERIDDPAVRGCDARRHGHEVRLVLAAEPQPEGSVEVPRFCAPLRDVRWAAGDAERPTVHPEPRHWAVRWRSVTPASREILLIFDEPPLLPAELEPIAATGDGSLLLSASRASTQGSKVRYEPQPHKNTVGFWAVASDSASWTIDVARPGTYAVTILQGCGAGQGGSEARLRLDRDDDTIATIAFTTVDTGHFQNFRWLDVGTLAIPSAGRHTVTIAPERIARAALCDIRAVSLVPQASDVAGAARPR